MKSAVAVLWLVLALMATACSGDDQPPVADDEQDEGVASLASPEAASDPSNEQPAAVSSSGGLQVVVFGMRNGTGLSLLDEPDGAEIGQITSGSNNVYFTGEAQNAASGELLWQVEHGDLVGWVPPRFGYPAVREDVTDEVASAFGATSAAQDNPVDTALVVSGLYSLTSPPSGIVVSNIIEATDAAGHVVIDVVDEGAVGVPGVLGYRIEVLTEVTDTKFEITEVWRTAMCQNGAADGSCL